MKSNTIAIVVGLVVIVGGLWYFFSGSSSDTQTPLSAGTENPAQTQFAVLVSQLQPIKFNTAIFDEPAFMALVDLSTPVSPEASGRLDPFAPLK